MPLAQPTTEMASPPALSPDLTVADIARRWSLRWGWKREQAAFPPGLYRLGEPSADSPVLVTCNYRMTVDIVRRDTRGLDAWLLVLDTHGINVWCAAGKGTFGTDELIRRIFDSHLAEYVDHTVIVVPQLGAPGVAAHLVRQTTGFRVVYGPVRSTDIRAFLDAGMHATDEMRAVTFTIAERAVLAPVELVNAVRWPFTAIPLALAVLAGIGRSWWSVADFLARTPGVESVYFLGVVSGGLLVPLLLPWLPGRAFAFKGAIIGGLLGGVFAASTGASALSMVAAVLGSAAISSFLGMQFTGSTPYTSPSGVEHELRRWLPLQAVAAIVAVVVWLATAFI